MYTYTCYILYIYIYNYIYIYIYSYARKGIGRQGLGSVVRSAYVSALCPVVICPYLCTSDTGNIYIYIYIHMYMCIYIYIYIYMSVRERFGSVRFVSKIKRFLWPAVRFGSFIIVCGSVRFDSWYSI